MATKKRKQPKRRNPVARKTIGGEQALRGGAHGKTNKASRRKEKVKLTKEIERELNNDSKCGPLIKEARKKYQNSEGKLKSYIHGVWQVESRPYIKDYLEIFWRSLFQG